MTYYVNTCSLMSDRHANRPWGLYGGQPGGTAGTWFSPANSDDWQGIDTAFNKVSPSKWSNVTIRPGDSIRFQTPGGGGWGDPKKRPREQVKEDLAEGYISKGAAEEIYGLNIVKE